MMLDFDDTLPTEDRWKVSQRLNSLAPASWREVRLGDVATVQNGAPFASGLFNKNQDGLPLIRIRDVGANSTDAFYSGEYEPDYLVEQGSILVGMDGDFRCRRWTGPVGLLNQRVCRIRVTSGFVDEDFAFSFLQPYLSAVEAVTSSITVKHLSSKTVADLRLVLPPLNEQKRIVAKIEALQLRSSAAKEALDAIPPLLEKFRQSILAAAFRGDLTKKWREAHPFTEPASKLLERIRAERRRRWEEANPRKKYAEPEPVDTTALPDLPEGWCWAWLSDCGEVSRGKSKHRPRNDERLFGDKYPFIQTGEVARSGGHISEATNYYSDFGLAQSRLFPAGTVCITIAANIADSAVLDLPACFPDSVVGVIPDAGLLSSEFIEFYIRTARDDLEAVAPATAQKNINLAVLSQVVVPVPPVLERLEIERIVNEAMGFLDGASDRQSTVATALASLNQSILAKAFRGELVPQDPNDEPASVLLKRIQAERQAAGGPKKKGGRGKKKAPRPTSTAKASIASSPRPVERPTIPMTGWTQPSLFEKADGQSDTPVDANPVAVRCVVCGVAEPESGTSLCSGCATKHK